MPDPTPASITTLVKDTTIEWGRAEPASEEAIEALKKFASFELPEDYLTFLRLSNGGEGELGVQPYWFQIWRAEEVAKWNQGYEIAEYFPGYFAFGGSGGGDWLAFRETGDDPRVYCSAYISSLEDVRVVTDSFAALVASMGREDLEKQP